MPVLDKPFYDLDEICSCWGITQRDLTAFVLAGELTLSATVAGLRVIYGTVEEVDINQWEMIPDGHRFIIGTVDMLRDDAWMVLREGSHEIVRLKAPDGEYVTIDDHHCDSRHIVRRDDLVVCRAEVDRFEAAHPELATIAGKAGSADRAHDQGEAGGVRSGQSRPGAPQRYDWDGFWVEVCRRIYEDGVPETQGELVRLMLDWFGESGRCVPDTSTLKKKISPLWGQIGISHAGDALQGARRHRV